MKLERDDRVRDDVGKFPRLARLIVTSLAVTILGCSAGEYLVVSPIAAARDSDAAARTKLSAENRNGLLVCSSCM